MASKWEWYWSQRAPFYFVTTNGYGDGIVDAEGRRVASHMPEDIGLLMASAPTMFATLVWLRTGLAPEDPRVAVIDRVIRRASDMNCRPIRPPTPEEQAAARARRHERKGSS